MATVTITIGKENWSKIDLANGRATFMTTQDNLKATMNKAYFLLNTPQDPNELEEDWFEEFKPN